MLILTRKIGEAIAIGEDVKITVLGIQGKQVKIGITAPEKVSVYREEIFRKIQNENVKASMSLKEDPPGTGPDNQGQQGKEAVI